LRTSPRRRARAGVLPVAALALVGLLGLLLSAIGLYGVMAYAVVLVAVCGVLAVAGLAAAYLPARRPSRLDPADILRTE
jgi:ABC-type antimicrobial peptide transport system permease subunit